MVWAGNPGMYKASDRTSVNRLARDIARIGTPELAEWFADVGLMNPIEEPEFLAARQMFGMTAGAWLSFVMVTETVATGKKDVQYNYFLDLVSHIMYGHDCEDEDSVGGYSQREIDLIAERIKDET